MVCVYDCTIPLILSCVRDVYGKFRPSDNITYVNNQCTSLWQVFMKVIIIDKSMMNVMVESLFHL